jgi:hypothetical protein
MEPTTTLISLTVWYWIHDSSARIWSRNSFKPHKNFSYSYSPIFIASLPKLCVYHYAPVFLFSKKTWWSKSSILLLENLI